MQNNEDRTVIDDIKDAKGYILGITGFAAAVTAFFVNAFGWDPMKTTAATAGIALAVLLFGFLILRSEKRHARALQEHVINSEHLVSELRDTMQRLENNSLETRRDTLRIQLSMYMKDQPDNVDTILRLAEEYFIKLHGDWYMTAEFNKWTKEHNIAVPQVISSAISENEK